MSQTDIGEETTISVKTVSTRKTSNALSTRRANNLNKPGVFNTAKPTL